MKAFWKVEDLKKTGFPTLPYKKLLLITLIANLASLALALLSQIFLPPQIPLYYGQAEAENIVAPSLALILPSIISLAFLGLNLLLSFVIKDDFLKKVMVISSFAASLFATTTIIKIAFLVGSF